MSPISAVVLGVIQGATEFLPVSSSGHLVLGQFLLGLREPDLFFDVFLHVATLLVVLIVFRSEIVALLSEVFTSLRSKDSLAVLKDTEFLKIAVATIPIAVAGVTARPFVEQLFANPKLVSLNLIITGCVLFASRFFEASNRVEDTISWRQAILVGFFQAFALAPGISRSGITISVALMAGCSRKAAARFSFLLFIPAVAGAFLLESLHVDFGAQYIKSVVAGFLAAFVVGYVALVWLLRLIRSGFFHRFAYYCWLLGLVGLLFL